MKFHNPKEKEKEEEKKKFHNITQDQHTHCQLVV